MCKHGSEAGLDLPGDSKAVFVGKVFHLQHLSSTEMVSNYRDQDKFSLDDIQSFLAKDAREIL